MKHRIYLDHAASSPMRPEARSAMDAVWGLVGNPSSLHASGRHARRVLEESREDLADSLGAHPTEVVFTSGGTEANNLILLGALDARANRPRVVIGDGEHPSVAGLADRHPDRVDVLKLDESGDLRPDLSVIGADTSLVSVMTVNNETGMIHRLDSVSAAARAAGAWLHTDAVQAFGHLALNFAASNAEAMTVTAHKVGGPVGIGALLLSRQLSLTAPGFGGGQERKLRSGTATTALAAGFAAAARAAVDERVAEAGRLRRLRQRLLEGISAAVTGTRVNGGERVSPAILNVTFEGCRADDLLLILDAAGFDCSTGSACTAGVHQPSDVLLAMGRTLAQASASLRFSFGPGTDHAAIDALLAELPAAVQKARAAFA